MSPAPIFTPTEPPLAYYEAGTDGPNVLLVMGYGMRGDVWQPQVDALAADHRLVYYDHRGLGASGDADTRYSIRLFAEDALAVMDAARFDRAHVVGVSMGGMIAQELALHAPERVQSLALIATHAGGLRSMLPTARGLSCFLRAQLASPDERSRALTELLYTEAFVTKCDRSRLEARMKAQVGVRAPRRTLLRQLGAIARHDMRRRLGRITAPTLIVRPGRDLLIRPGNSDALHRSIPDSKLIRMDETGHGCIFESAEAIAGALRSHFRREPIEAAKRAG